MAFSKSFPKTVEGSSYPQWKEITLTEEEEKRAEDLCQKKNFLIYDQCIDEAKILAIKHQMNTDENRIAIATALFEKRASHVVFWKERLAKEKFDKTYNH